MNINSLVRFLLRQLVSAGDYALRIQAHVRSSEEKGGNIFSAVVSDADLSVQNFFEVALLSHYPQFSFFGEEYEKSLNTEYFPKDAEYEVALDPINGTRLFVDQYDTFDIVVSVVRAGRIAAAITYLPARAVCYFAVDGLGAFTLSREEMLQDSPWRPLTICSSSARVMVFNQPELKARLLGKVDVVDFVEEYLRKPSSVTLNSVLTGELGGWVRQNAPLIDLGAIGFIADLAGGRATDFHGAPVLPFVNHSTPEIVVASAPELHQQIIDAL